MADRINLPDIAARLRLDTTGFDRAFTRAQRSLQKSGQSVAATGRTLSRNLSLPLAAAGVASIKLAVDFETSMSRIQGLVGASQEQVAGWRDDILGLAGELPQAPRELAEALYFVTSSGIDASNAMDVVEKSARAAAAGLGETKTVADAVTSAINAYGAEAISAEEATDVLTATVREGKGEADELAGAIGRVIAPAQALGIEFHEVGGAMSSLTLLGLDASEAATGLRGIISSLIKPSDKARGTFEDLGLSVDKMREDVAKKGLLDTLISLRERIGDNKDAIGALFPNVRALNAFLILTGENAEQNTDIFAELADATGATDAAFEAASHTLGFRFQAAMSRVQAGAIRMGDIIAPIFADIASGVAGLVEGFGRLPSVVQKVALGFAGLLAVTGPLLTVVGTMVATFGKFARAIAITTGLLDALALVGTWDALSRGVEVTSRAQAVMGGLRVQTAALGRGLRSLVSAAIHPVTIAIAAAITAYTIWKRKKEQVRAETEAFTRALVDEKKGIEGSSDAALEAALRDREVLDDIRKAGIPLARVFSAIRGKVQLTYAEILKLEDTLGTFKKLTGFGSTAGEEINQLAAEFGDARIEADYLREAEKQEARATDAMGRRAAYAREQLSGQQRATRDAANALAGITDESDQAAAALQRVADAFEDAIGESLDVAEARIRVKEAFVELRKQLKRNSSTLDENTKKGRENKQAVIDLIRRIHDQAEAWAVATGNEEDANAIQKKQIEGLRQLKHDFPELTGFVQRYIDALRDAGAAARDLPTTIETRVKYKIPEIAIRTRRSTADGNTWFIRPEFLDAKVFHQGGTVPGQPGEERIIVAEAGERIRTRAQERALQGRMGGGSVTIQLYGHASDNEAMVRRVIREELGEEVAYDEQMGRMYR
jgi:TP901 family phage tail tape measure protein